jgi:two-component system, chemotaxis family, CheB/CheR fusion protein
MIGPQENCAGRPAANPLTMTSDESGFPAPVQEAPESNPPPHFARSPNHPVVGIGASAGGIQALLRFFEHMPDDTGMAFVIVLHLSPLYESAADEVLQRVTAMPVHQVLVSTRIEPNTVYLISPSNNLSMVNGTLHVTAAEPQRGRPVAIDLFLRSLAEAHQERAIAIILSGTGSDGAAGIGRVKEQAGITLVQSPLDAEYDEMPRNALATGFIDFVLPAAEMGPKLAELWRNAQAIHLPEADDDEPEAAVETVNTAAEAERALRDILHTLRARTGHDFRHYKRATVLRRIERRLQVNALADLPSYQRFVQTHPDETAALLKDMLIGVTQFFRDRAIFDVLEREVLPKLFENKSRDDFIRVWAAGCSTGEEAYSLCMLLAEEASRLPSAPTIQMFATDIDERAIGIARGGVYPESITGDVPPTVLRRFFTKLNARYQVQKTIRERILFADHNILRDPPFSRLDLVSCRNLLIYLDRKIQRQVLQTFHFALRPGGFLLLGSSESAEVATDLFSPVDKRHRIYRAIGTASPARSDEPLSFEAPQLPPLASREPSSGVHRTAASLGSLHRRALEQWAPPSVIVDRNSRILHISHGAGRYLRYVGGEPSHDLLAVIAPALRFELRAALIEAARAGIAVETRAVTLQQEDGRVLVGMTVRMHRDAAADAEVLLVLFHESEEVDPAGRMADLEEVDPERMTMLERLEDELERTKDHLQSTIEQSSVSTEELKASNEELQAINEELRSATEELETSKEELQSVNEELTTVNAELQGKVEETAKANDDLQNLIASTGIATIFVDRQMRIKRYTAAAVGLFNLISTDLGRPLLDLTHHLDYPELADDAASTFETLAITQREVRSDDGRWYLVRVLPYRTSDDRIDGAVLTLIDISARRRAEDAARVSDERLKLAALSTNDYAIVVSDPEGLIVSWNNGAERVFGYSERDVVGQAMDLIFAPEDRAAGVPAEERTRARITGRTEDERWYVRKDGARIYCSGVVSPLESADFQGFAKIARDLTAQKSAQGFQQHQLSLERSVREQAEEANRVKDEFFAVLSHELKNPLNLIHVKADLLMRVPEAKDIAVVQDAADAIRRSVVAQAKIIDDLLDLSRVRTGKLALQFAPVDIAMIARSVAEASALDAEKDKIEMHLSGADAPLVIEADAVRFEQIMWNLVRNALKFNRPGGSIDIALHVQGARICAEVRNTGQGIDASFMPKIFDMFSQADAGRRNRTGLGIGLSLTRQLTEMHGGEIEVESAGLGHGATFRVWLPAARVPGTLMPVSLATDTAILRGLRVLLVDDSVDTLQAFRDLLEIEEAVVTAFSRGAEALEAAAKQDFDVLLSDIGMPDVNGYELISLLRKQPRSARIAAVALTGYGRAQDAEQALRAGFDAHLGKPVSLDALLGAIERSLRNWG